MGGLRKDLGRVWKNFAPPKVQFLGWLAFLERVKTAELLFSWGIFHDFNGCLCHFCGDAPESVNHLFIHYRLVWSIWCRVISWWNLKWVCPISVKSLFNWWQGWKFKKVKKVLWVLAYFAVLWSIWIFRNELIFQGVTPKWYHLEDIIKYRIACWFRAFRDSRKYAFSDVLARLPSLV